MTCWSRWAAFAEVTFWTSTEDRWGEEEGVVLKVDESGADPEEQQARVRVSQLIETARAIGEPVVAVEALWDGDTEGWFVELVAIVRRPGRCHPHFDERPLAMFRHGSDLRAFNGEVPPWLEAVEATEKGQAVARTLGVPFHFTSPDTPDVELPRWWDGNTG